MTVGQTWPVEAVSVEDSQTGVAIERITDDVANTYYPYFTQPIVSADANFVLLASDRAGAWQLFVRDMAGRRIVQLTDARGVRASGACMDPVRGRVYYFADRELRGVGLDGSGDRAIYACPAGYRPGILSVSSCGRYLAFAYVEDLPVSTQTGKIYSDMAERLYQRPRSVLMRVDVTDGRAQALFGECRWYSHVSIDPTDADCVLFCHEGAWHLVQRMWVARADTQEVRPLIAQKRLLERSGHEYFTDRGVVVTQYAVRDDPRTNAWRHANILVEPDGSNERRFWYDGVQPMHVQTSHAADARMIGDCGPRKDWEQKGPEGWLSLIRLADGRSGMTPLCRHSTGWLDQKSHPHPVFWPGDEFVLFNSDGPVGRDGCGGGRNNAYRARAALPK
ncbi:MAG: Oligogalacturonate lyase [Phycisphaerae bacterium]|nr:Oligogalacturonate lyase [Phycisphaerae bacterium]